MAELTAVGRPSALASIILAGFAGWYTVATTTRFPDAVTQFVSFGWVVLVLAVVIGSRFAVGSGVLIALAGAVIEIGTVSEQRWGRSLIIACLWYLAAELAWDSMERRDGRRRSQAVELERAREIGYVLVVSSIVTLVAVASAGAAPPRTLLVLALTVGAVALTLAVGARHLAAMDSPGVHRQSEGEDDVVGDG